MKRTLIILSLLMVLIACLPVHQRTTPGIVLSGGESMVVICDGDQLLAGWRSPTEFSLYCMPHPPTSTPTVTPTQQPPIPTSTPPLSQVWHGIVRSPQSAWLTMRNELDATVVEFLVKPSHSDSAILAGLDDARAQGLQVLLHIYDRSTSCDVPWDLANGEWTISSRGIEILNLVENHPAVWAVYTLEEPWDPSSGCYADADTQRAMYTFLRQYTDLPLYTDEGSLWRAVQEGHDIGDGMCDYCCVAPTKWSAGLSETMQHITNEYQTWQATMTDSQLVFMVNVFGGAGHQMPAAGELDTARDYMCSLGVPQVYYSWVGYTENLGNTPELWPVVAEGCGEPGTTPTPPPTGIPGPTATPAPPTNTPLPPPLPTNTPGPGGALVIDHTNVDASIIPITSLNNARVLATFFNHRSIGNNILDGIAALQSQNPTRYSISVQYSSGTSPGINHYQAGSNLNPISKINGFASNVKSGHDAAFMKFCVGDFEPWASVDAYDIWVAYRNMMIAQQSAHPNTVVVWWTSPLTTQSDARGLASFSEFNGYVRAYVNANGGVLFDIADIESHDPSGNPVTSGAYEAMYNGYSTDGAHLNSTGNQRVAGAIWHLLAQMD